MLEILLQIVLLTSSVLGLWLSLCPILPLLLQGLVLRCTKRATLFSLPQLPLSNNHIIFLFRLRSLVPFPVLAALDYRSEWAHTGGCS